MLFALLKRAGQPVPFTGFLLDLLKEEFGSEEGVPDNPHAQAIAIKGAIKASGLLAHPRLKHCDYVLTRMQALVAMAKEGGDEKDEKEEPSLGTAYLKWIRKLDFQQMCLFLGKYNLSEARRLYTEVDMEDVSRMYADRVAYDFEVARLQFEASMFGFGGSYGGDKAKSSPVDAGVTDLTKASNADVERIFRDVF